MKTKDRYAFKLIVKASPASESVAEYAVHPRFDDMVLQYKKDSDKVYYTESLNADFKFIGNEFDIIQSQSVFAQFTLVITNTSLGREVVRGTFRKTDCETDINHRIVSVKINTDKSSYDRISDKASEEYNLIRLGLKKKTLSLWHNPARQVYIAGDTKLHIFPKNGHTDVDCTETTSLKGLEDMQFNQQGAAGAIICNIESSGSVNLMNGVYYGSSNNASSMRLNNDKGYYIFVSLAGGSLEAAWYDDTNTEIAHTMPIQNLDTYRNTTLEFEPADGSAIIIVQCRFWLPFVRLVSNHSGVVIGEDDLWHGSYKLAESAIMCYISVSTETSPTDNGYPIIANRTEYYAPPTNSGVKWYPVWQESWFSGVSVWLSSYNEPTTGDINNRRVKISIPDFYSLGDAIKAVIGKIDADIVFEKDEQHSAFLFASTNPITNEAQRELFISQKSNILSLQYDYAAWKAPITWDRIVTLLKNAFNCYYDIYIDADGKKHLRIEHINYYLNGGTYNDAGASRPIVDLTAIYNTRNLNTLAFLSNHWSYDNDGGQSQAQRITFGWMDTQTEKFDGLPIIIPDQYNMFDKQTTDERVIDWFSSDIDFLTAVPTECSSDGFVVVMVDTIDPTMVCQQPQATTISGFIVVDPNGNKDVWSYPSQNYRLSMAYLQNAFMRTNLFAPYITMNGSDELVKVQKLKGMRVGELSFITALSMQLSPTSLYRTEVGDGIVDDMSIDLTSGKVTLKLRYETEK